MFNNFCINKLSRACSQKLMEWQTLNTNCDTPRNQNTLKTPSKLIVPYAAEEATMYLFEHITDIKKPNTTSSIVNIDSDYHRARFKR